MTRVFWATHSEVCSWQILDLLAICSDHKNENIIIVKNTQRPQWKLVKDLKNISILTENDIAEKKDIDEVYCFDSNPDIKKTLSRLNPQNVYFFNKEFSKEKKILTEEEVYFLKFFHTNSNLLTFQSLLATKLSLNLQKKKNPDIEPERFGFVIEEILSNDEIFFWRKIISIKAAFKPVDLYAPPEVKEALFAFGELSNVNLKEIKNILFPFNKYHWFIKNNYWQYVLNIYDQKTTVLCTGNLSVNKLSYGPNISYFFCDFQIKNFHKYQAFFNQLRVPTSYNGLILWSNQLETWNFFEYKALDINQFMDHLYFLYWNFYIREKEVHLRNFLFDSSLNKNNISILMSFLSDIYNLMDNLKYFTTQQIDVLAFEKFLHGTNNSFLKIIKSSPKLKPIYMSFSVTSTPSRNLSFNDILNFYHNKANEIQVFSSVIYQLLENFSKKNNIVVNL